MARNRKSKLSFVYKNLKPIFLIVAFAIMVWLYFDDESSAKYAEPVVSTVANWTGKIGLKLENIYVSGHSYSSESDIISILEVNKGLPMFAIDLKESRQKLENIGWIKRARIERQLPNTLHIIVEERKPFAIWQYRGKINLIDNDGNVIVEGGTFGFSELPIIVGEDANIHIGSLFKFLSMDSKMLEKISSVIRVGGRRWNIRLKNGIEVKLPEENPDVAWENLLRLNHEKNILDREIKLVDLRVEGRLFIEPNKDIK